MTRTSSLTRRLCTVLLALMLVLTYPPILTFAEETSTTATPAQPDGPAANTYTFNESTGMWENDHYIWDPVTHKTYPKDKLTYSYNPATGMWDTTEWVYNAASGKYEPNVHSVTQPPQGSETTGGPSVAPPPQPSNSPPPQQSVGEASSGVNGTGSTNPTAFTNAPTSDKSNTFSGFYNATISNNYISSAMSGDASVTHNTTGGNAQSGNAESVSTIVNLLQSSTAIGDLNRVATFTTNIDGDVFGDLYIDPNIITSPNPSPNGLLPTNITISSATNSVINNNISVDASSGSATISDNTTAGNATTGNANAVVNLVNLLNSSISAGQSFLGILNINGSFNGDVLLPPGTLNALLSSNQTANQGNLVVTNSDNQNINNNVTTTASSGNASVAHNTIGGSSTTGKSTTNLTVLNLTGHDIVGSNSLLVFVNVLGQWMGAIVDAPNGATAAAIGGGVTRNSLEDANISSTSNSSIDNRVDVNASSGDASVDHNTVAGDAQSGNATASVNIANISYSSLSLSDWFGVLFINVFGTWNGSFGIDTEAGGILTPNATTTEDPASAPIQKSGASPEVFRFVPRPKATLRATRPAQTIDEYAQNIIAAQDHTGDNKQPGVLGATNRDNGNHTGTFLSPSQRDINMAVSAVIIGAVLVGIERVLAYRDNRKLMQNK